uniref:Uncharacterized protein n=1 Tax=Amphimedon queenslandica TaxID=400682 RepID=A0A1X7UI13_AMPQE
MPRYLALNYLELLNRERRHLLDRCLFPVPGQIESIDQYPHHGDLPSKYLFPWKPLVIEKGVAKRTLEEELDGLKFEGKHDPLEMYSTDEQQHNYSATGSEVDLFERAAADLIIKTEIENIRRVDGIEDFNYEPINIDHCDITGDPVLFLLEEPLDHSLVSPPILHTSLPSVGALLKRLRPILVQDPLVDKIGRKYEIRLENLTISLTITNPMTSQVESFTKEPLDEAEYSTHLIENPLTLHRPFSPKPITQYINEELQSLATTEGSEELEDKEGLIDIGDMCKDLTQSLTRDRGGGVPAVTDRFLLASSFGDSVGNGSCSSAGLCFEDLNNTGLGTEVSMFESQLLESPEILSALEVPDFLGTELIDLVVFDDDTLLNERLLSVSDERRLFNRLRTLDHTFDSIASKVLPCTDITVQLGDINNNLIDQSISTLQPIKLHGDLELSLPWDPVFYSSVSMRDAVNNTLTRSFHDTGGSDCTAIATDHNGQSVVSLGAMDIEKAGFDMDYIRWVNGFDATLMSLNQPPPTTNSTSIITNEVSITSTTRSLSHSLSLPPSLTSATTNVNISSGFDSFLLLRGMGDVGAALNDPINKAAPSSVSLLSSGERNQPTISDSCNIIEPDSDLILVKAKDRPVTRVEIQVSITGDYKRLLERLNSLTSPLLKQFLGVVRGVANKALLSDVPIDSLKFFMKQQEMNCHWNTTDNYVSSLVLFIIGSLIRELLNTSIQSAMDLFNGLCNKYRTLILSSHNHMSLLLLDYLIYYH